MRKTNKNKVLFGVVLALLSLSSCQKGGHEVSQHLSPHSVYTDSQDAKTDNYWLTTEIGHDGRTCSGCILFRGHMIHVDCMGHGHYCRPVARVNINIDGDDISVTTTDTFGLTTEDFFFMPDRSLDYTDADNNRVYLNIPEQLVYRDTTTQQFTFTGLFFTDAPEYANY